ncbi:MAG TPA: Uma2 family endonuclease [Longimicrobium sp.]|nr:Uma2 family endonuclease [Longimicrobium sp.]
MATHPARRGWSYAEFARLPDDGNRYEIIAGELCVTPSPRPLHQEMVSRLVELLGPFIRKHRMGRLYPGPIDVLFDEGDYLIPDLVFVRREKAATVTDRGVESPPDLVIEIISPSTALRDRGVKRARYAQFGVPEYWVVDAQLGRLEIYRPVNDVPDVVAAGSFVWGPAAGGPELSIDVDELFSDLD